MGDWHMKRSKALKILEKTAVKEGVSVAEVRCGIQEALDVAYENRNESNADFWGKWHGKPNVEEFIVAIQGKTLDKLGVKRK
jgi:hypothetical protein